MDSYLPKEIGQMRELQRTPRGRTWSETRLFYEQARLMEDFEDNCPYHGQFQSYYPTYRTMTDRQLRGYFTWRARVRAGQVEQTAASFAYVYLYELLMGIGVEPAARPWTPSRPSGRRTASLTPAWTATRPSGWWTTSWSTIFRQSWPPPTRTWSTTPP